VFKSKTQLTLCEACDLPELGLSLVNIVEICAHTHDYEYLVGEYYIVCLVLIDFN
jgi:hypothetical protein